ncbi:MAG TPA: hypothetical protein VHF89_07030 [Solirubrobacteraceae bacterium]|nr:hypothetical protein [Solirubrobacteraceae bacterium]
MLLEAARFELNRRRRSLTHLTDFQIERLAEQATDDAIGEVLVELDAYRGTSRFTTWACKFVLKEAAVIARRLSWAECERSAEARTPPEHVARAIETVLTPHERTVVRALALDGVPIDVLADRMHTTRGLLYATLHEARRRLKPALGPQLLRDTA